MRFLLLAAVFLLGGCAQTQLKPGAGFAAGYPAEVGDGVPINSSANGEVIDPVAPKGLDNPPDVAMTEERPNTLAPGFLIRLGHQEDRDLNGNFHIGFDGKIDLPYNVSFKAEGMTMDEFRQKVMESYKPYFKSGIKLTVELVEKIYYIELRGLITKPGKYKVHSDASLDEVISLAGGFPIAVDSQPRFLKITHGDKTQMVNMDEYYKSGSLRAAVSWHGGEILFFQKEDASTDPGTLESGNQVQVLGELKRTGKVAFRPGADVYFYLVEAGGPTQNLDFAKVQIYRGAPGKRTMTEFDLEEPKKVPIVEPGDILVFQADRPTRFQKDMGTAANIASILTAIALLIIAL